MRIPERDVICNHHSISKKCVCMCVCVREREREKDDKIRTFNKPENERKGKVHVFGSSAFVLSTP